jgi:hypothetical protein
MMQRKDSKFKTRKFAYLSLTLAILMLAAVTRTNSQEDRKIETITATARGTSTQSGRQVSINVIISRFSTEEERAVLVDAFKKGQNAGLVDALSKMKSAGRIAITGTVGSELAYIRLIRTDTGRKIRFATNRPIRFGEAYRNSTTTAFNLTAGEFDLNDSDKNKSTGVLYPAAQLVINKEGQLEFQLNENHWNLVGIVDWNQAGSKE